MAASFRVINGNVIFMILSIFCWLICLFSVTEVESTNSAYVKNAKRCPGLYCGRTKDENDSWSDCKACMRGYRPNNASECIECSDKPTFYDWLYLVFMALLPLLLHWFFIDQSATRACFTWRLLVVHFSALIESMGAAVLTLLVVEPVGSLEVKSCKVVRLADWYTMLYNPKPGYVNTLHCTQEAVYPLYSMVFIYYAFSLVFMMLFRPLLVYKIFLGKGFEAIYAALYFFPILVVVHAVCGGMIYYSFPYMTIFISVITSAAHFSFRHNQTMKALVMMTLMDTRNIVILLGHWMLHAFGIIAITQLNEPLFHASLIALVPFPAIFYILTARFTDPTKLHTD